MPLPNKNFYRLPSKHFEFCRRSYPTLRSINYSKNGSVKSKRKGWCGQELYDEKLGRQETAMLPSRLPQIVHFKRLVYPCSLTFGCAERSPKLQAFSLVNLVAGKRQTKAHLLLLRSITPRI